MRAKAAFHLNNDDAASNVTCTNLTKGNIFIGDFQDYCERKGDNVVKKEIATLANLLKKMSESKSNAVYYTNWNETDESRFELLKNAFTETSMSLRWLIHIKQASLKDMVDLICNMSVQNMKRLCRLFLDMFKLPLKVFESCLKRIHLELTFSPFCFFLINFCSSLESATNGSCVFIDVNLVKGKNIKVSIGYWTVKSGSCHFIIHRAFGVLNYAQSFLDQGFHVDTVCNIIESTNNKYQNNRNEYFTGSHRCHQASCVDKKCMWFEKLSVNQARNACKDSKDPIKFKCQFEPKCLVHNPDFVKPVGYIKNLDVAETNDRIATLEARNFELGEKLAEEHELRVKAEKELEHIRCQFNKLVKISQGLVQHSCKTMEADKNGNDGESSNNK